MADRSAPDPAKRPDRVNQPLEPGGDIRHIADTLLPPGVTPDDVKDPGSQPPDDRIDRPNPENERERRR